MNKKKGEKSQKRVSIIVMFIVVIAVAFLGLIGFITDWLWFSEMGYVGVFFKKLFTQLQIGIPVFIIITMLVQFYLTSLRKGYFKKIESHEIPDLKSLNKITVGISVLFGVITSVVMVSQIWFDALKYLNSTNFGLKDPLFNLDISFYIFKLEFLGQLNEIVLGIIILLIVVTVAYYAILLTVRTPDVFEGQPEEPKDETRYSGKNNPFSDFAKGKGGSVLESIMNKAGDKTRNAASFDSGNFNNLIDIASGKLMILGVIFYAMIGVDFYIRQFSLLHVHTGAVYGAGYTDIMVTLWMYRIIMALSVVGAITIAFQIKKKDFKKILRVPAAMVIVGVLGFGIAYAVQAIVVSPDEINKESQYLKNNIEFTQYAYDIHQVDIQPFAADQSLTADDIENNPETISNVRINDYEPVNTFYNQTQSIRQYYAFNDVDVDRYMINGEYTQAYLATREIDKTKTSDTWLNKHIKYTHGYGITLSKVDEVTPSGQPNVLIKNIPPVSTVDEIEIDRPAVYFGELTNDYVLVNTKEEEFDYPDGDENKYVMYDGEAGIKLGFFNKLMFSIREGSLKMLVSTNLNKDSKIIINRNVMDRVKTIMPYLSYENDPYMVTADGNLYWMIDAYTTSTYYPYSEPYNGEVGNTNYIRNSVKVVVDAYDGDVKFYIVDEEDPIAMTYAKIYPELFKTFDKLPESLRSHIRYPNALFEIQADVYTRYHMTQPKVFYQNEDLWDIANEIYGTEQVPMSPNYYIVKLPGEEKAEFINSIPYTPRSKQNMTALLIARNDGADYGNLVLYKFPKNKTVYGPMQIEAQIDQVTEISKEFSLWNSSGSSYSRGNMFVIPLESSILYVEPVYLEASNQAIPEVKRVIVAYGERIAYEETFSEALTSLFGGDNGDNDKANVVEDDVAGGLKIDELIEAANDAYEDALEAQQNGDWAAYGNHMKDLEKYLNLLEQ
ncbi:MAG: UPF0182 family protein [Clostridiales bacterium]|nr:UPF0182 family protein [Clostridiales bacterium]